MAEQRFLARPEWRLAEPIDLGALNLGLVSEPVHGDEHFKVLQRYWPSSETGAPLHRYHEVVSTYAKPRNWFNGASYRLTDVARLASGGFRLDFSLMRYWDGLDSSAALAYEAAHAYLASEGSTIGGPYRKQLKDPFDVAGRNCAFGISALTIRRAEDGSTFYLHRRTGGVAVMGGMMGCLPAGEFQPSAESAESAERDDLDIGRCMMREYAEELLGFEEAAGPIDYDRVSPYREMQDARRTGAVRPYLLDFGIDPLTWKAGIRLAYVFDAAAFDKIFREMVFENAEGSLVVPKSAGAGNGPIQGWRFDEETVRKFIADPTTTEALKQCLDLAWRHRTILGLPG